MQVYTHCDLILHKWQIKMPMNPTFQVEKEKEKNDMEIMKVKNYKVFAETLKKKTGCEVTIKIMNSKDHYHFQLNKDGISLGVLCLDQGEASFAPFVSLDTAKDDQYINVKYMPMLEDFIGVLKVFDEMFVCEEEV